MVDILFKMFSSCKKFCPNFFLNLTIPQGPTGPAA